MGAGRLSGALLHTAQHAFLCFATVLKRRFCRYPLARFGRFAAARSLGCSVQAVFFDSSHIRGSEHSFKCEYM